MPIELNKREKKLARELIQNSLQIECAKFVEETEVLIDEHKREGKTAHEIYLKLYDKTRSFDKHIARRYDDMRGSRYFLTLLGLLHDEILKKEDIDLFDEEVRNKLLNSAKLWDTE